MVMNMDMWSWIAWGVSIFVALTGLYFGLKADRRARYGRLWVLRSEPGRVVNRTGEDAHNVLVFIEEGTQTLGVLRVAAVAPDEEIGLDESAVGNEITVVWVRPSSGRMYTWPWGLISWWRSRHLRWAWFRTRTKHQIRALRKPTLDAALREP